MPLIRDFHIFKNRIFINGHTDVFVNCSSMTLKRARQSSNSLDHTSLRYDVIILRANQNLENCENKKLINRTTHILQIISSYDTILRQKPTDITRLLARYDLPCTQRTDYTSAYPSHYILLIIVVICALFFRTTHTSPITTNVLLRQQNK